MTQGPKETRPPSIGRTEYRPLWPILVGPAESAPSADSVDSVRRDVKENVRRILGSRRGRCSGHREFGLPDVSEYFVGAKGFRELKRDLLEAIKKWEPRIVSPVQIDEDPNPEATGGPLRVRLVITARLKAPFDGSCRLLTTIGADGKVKVE